MQNHKWLWYKEAVCPICYQKFMYFDELKQPPTCGKLECLQKHYGIDKLKRLTMG